MSAAFGSFLTALGEGAGDYGQIQHKGTIDALNEEAEMVKAQRLMALEESQLASSNMFKMANLDMEGQRLELSKQAGARAEAELQMKRDEAALGDYKYEKRDIRQVVYQDDPLNPGMKKPVSVVVGTEWIRFNDKDPSDVQVLKPGQTTWSSYKPEAGGTGTGTLSALHTGSRGELETIFKQEFQSRVGRDATDAEVTKGVDGMLANGAYKLADGSSTTTINPAGQDAGVPTLPPRKDIPGSQDLQPYEWSEERLDYELKHFSQKKGTRKAVKKIISDVGESIDKVIEKLSVDNKEDNAFIARLLGTGADGIIYMVNQFASGEEVFIETELGAVQWLMDNRGMTIADVVKWFRTNSQNEREVIEPGDSGAVIPTENIDPRKNKILSAEAQAAITSIDGTQPPPEKPFEISAEAKRMMEINEIPEAQGSKALATIAQAIGDPVEVITEAINSLPKDSAVIKIIRHWENQDFDEITSAIEMVKEQIAKIIPSASEPMPEDQFNLARFKAADANSMITVGDGLITGGAPVPVGALGVEHPDEGMSEGLYVGPEVSGVSMGAAYPTVAQPLPAATLPLEHGQDDPRIDDGPGLLDIKVALDPTQRSRRWDTSRGRQGEGGLSMDADYRTLPGTLPRAHGQDDPQEAGRLTRADVKAMVETAIMRPKEVVETDIFKMNYDESIQIIREVVGNLVRSGMSNNAVIDHLFRIVEGTSKSDVKKFNKSAYKKALNDIIIGLHTQNK